MERCLRLLLDRGRLVEELSPKFGPAQRSRFTFPGLAAKAAPGPIANTTTNETAARARINAAPAATRSEPTKSTQHLLVATPAQSDALKDPARLSEAAIQRAVLSHLAHRRLPNLVYFAVPNGGWRSKTEGAILNGLGVVAGIPDIILIYNTRTYGLELKSETGQRSPAQILAQSQLLKAGAVVATAYGLNHAIAILKAWGMVRLTG